MIYAVHMIYAARMKGTDIISCLQRKYIMRRRPYIILRQQYIIEKQPKSSIMSEKELISMSDNKLLDLSLEFAAVIVDLVNHINIPKSAYMTDQLGRAGTSIGANIHEAQYAQSRKDFISKLEIALKESNETSYWLKLLLKTNRIDEQTHYRAEMLCGNIRRLLIASVRTAKENQK